jgi:N-methylhydantoinase B
VSIGIEMNPIVMLELIRESLVAVVDEMRANVIHSSYSSIIYEGHDFSCALLSADGRLVAQSLADHPIHSLAIPFSAREVAKSFASDINPGDVFLHNDPYTGGTHLNDVLMLWPVFFEGKHVLFAAVRCHWGDVGGMTAGSLSGQVTEILQEGIRILPTRVLSEGAENKAFLDLIFSNMRLPTERRGDFNTMLGACHRADIHLNRLFRRFGYDILLASIAEMFDRAERVMRKGIGACPPGVYSSEGYLESNGWTLDPLVARLTLTVASDSVTADFTGSSPQTPGTTNSGPAIPLTAVVSIVKSFLDPATAINHGSIAPINVIAPLGTFLNARPPAPCGGMAEVKYLLDSVVAAAFGRILPDKMIADQKGTGNHTYIAGRGNTDFLLYEWPAGGTGAVADADGNNVLRGFTEGDFSSIHPVEVLERNYPLRVERSELRVGSCGDGRQRGGLGLLRDVRVLSDEASLSVLSERNVLPPAGVAGGHHSAPNRFSVLREGAVISPSRIPGKISGFPLRQHDVVRIESAGGGGYGDPLDRDAMLVRQDVLSGYLTALQASCRYGVVLDGAQLIDEAMTARSRQDIRSRRTHVRIAAADAELDGGPRRLFRIPAGLADVLALSEGAVVEICAPRAPSLRGWVTLSEPLPVFAIVVGPSAIDILGVKSGDCVELRSIRIEQR